MPTKNNQPSKPTLAARRAQSARDKRANHHQASGVSSTAVVPRAFIGNMGNSPRMRATGSGVIITNTESLGPVSGTTSASITRNFLIPANMPWLSRVASAYSKYRWRRLRVFYLTQVSTSTEGRFAMGLSYDPIDPLLTTVTEIVSLNRSTFGPVWAGQAGFDSSSPFAQKSGLVSLDLDTSKLSKSWYNYATDAAITAMDAGERTAYVPALISSGTDGLAATKTVGSIYVAYELELIEPTPVQ